MASTIPWMVTTGNHEMEPLFDGHGYSGLQQRFALPGNGPAQWPSVYFFKYSNVGVVSLDANDVTYELATNRGYSKGVQAQWLDKALGGLRADPEIDFIVVSFHQCPYSSCAGHGCDAGVRGAWTALLDPYTVDLLINGHNHSYERTDPLHGGAPVMQAVAGFTMWPASAARRTWWPVVVVSRWTGSSATAPRRCGPNPGGRSGAGRLVAGPLPGFSYLSVRVEPGAGRSAMAVRALRPDGTGRDSVTLARANTCRAQGPREPRGRR